MGERHNGDGEVVPTPIRGTLGGSGDRDRDQGPCSRNNESMGTMLHWANLKLTFSRRQIDNVDVTRTAFCAWGPRPPMTQVTRASKFLHPR